MLALTCGFRLVVVQLRRVFETFGPMAVLLLPSRTELQSIVRSGGFGSDRACFEDK